MFNQNYPGNESFTITLINLWYFSRCIRQIGKSQAKPTQATKLALQQAIQQHNDSLCYPLIHIKIKMELMSAGSNHFEFENLFFGRVPNHLTIGTVENRAIYGQYEQNLFHFKHNHLESLVITVDSETMLQLDFDFVHGHYEEAYDTLIQSTGQSKGHRAALVNYRDFGYGSTILVFDLTSKGECDSEQFTVNKLSNVHLNLKFADPSPETNNLLPYGEFDGVLETDANQNIFTDYL